MQLFPYLPSFIVSIRKLLEPLAEIVRNTQAKSLLFESVYTITLCLPYSRKSDGSMPANVPSIVDLCADTLLNFVEENDQNLKYLGLVGFGSLMQSHPHVLGDPKYRPLILSCLSDEDETIRSRALELCPSITTRKNLTELVGQLMKHVESASGSYKIELATKIIDMCSSEKYALLQDFDWYLGVLFRLGHLGGVERLGGLLREQIISVALRVLPVRAAAVRRSIQVLLEDMQGTSKKEGKQAVDPILPALAWIVGEYSSYIREAIEDLGERFNSAYIALVRRLTDTNNKSPYTEKVYVHSAIKVTAAASADLLTSDEDLEACIQQLFNTLPVFSHSLNVEVAMRACVTLDILTLLGLQAGDNHSVMKSTGDLLGIRARSEEKDEVEMDIGRSVAQKARSCSSMLCYLVKSSPMKPCGSKLQKKKSQASLGGDNSLVAGSNESVFMTLIQEEVDATRDTDLGIQSISFTCQDIPTETAALNFKQDIMQNMHSSGFDAKKKLDDDPKRRIDDPFYLDETHGEQTTTTTTKSPRFGAIQLLDSDNDDSMQKKKKKSKKSKEKHSIKNQSMAVTMFDDDEEEDSVVKMGMTRKPGQEYAGLAKVDLTAPTEQPLSKSKLRKKKRSKTSSKTEKRRQIQRGTPEKDQQMVGDLLDLGGMDSGEGTVFFQSLPANPVGSAFDAFASPSIVASETLNTLAADLSPWMKVIIKEQASDSTLSSVEVESCYQNSAVSFIQTKITNNSCSALSSITMELKSPHTVIDYGTIEVNETVHRETRLHPAPRDCNQELKGSLLVNGKAYPVKVRVPFAISLRSEIKTATLQELAEELAMPGWVSSSVKVPLRVEFPFKQAVETLQGLMSAKVVDFAAPSSTAALASQTTSGSPIRLLIKMKGKYLKVDVKAKQEETIDAIVNDLKRLRL